MTITAGMIATARQMTTAKLTLGKSPLDAPKEGLFLTKGAEEGMAILALHKGSITPVMSIDFEENNLDFALAIHQMMDKHPELEPHK